MLSDVLLPVLHNQLRPVDGVQRGSFSPRSLFLAGEQGGWWDPSDFSTMFQDSAGTTPVTAAGQPVGLIRDKSGRGNHASQATAASRPTLQQDAGGFWHLLFDGVDDALATALVDFSASDKMTLWAGVTKNSDAAVACLFEGNTGTSPGMFAPATTATGDFSFRTFGTTAPVTGTTTNSFAAPASRVLSAALDNAGGTAATQVQARINAVGQVLTLGAVTGAGNMPNQVWNIGRRAGGTLPFNGRIYSLIVRGAISSAAQIAQTERSVGSKMGIAL